MEQDGRFGEGDWIVHVHYGVGQIKGIEVKGISGQESEYYRIETADSIFWIPLDQMDGEAVRPLSTPEDIHQAISALAKPPKSMSSNHRTRQNRIEQVQHQNTPEDIARLIRDLRAWQREKGGLNKSERSAYRLLRQRFADEWAIVAGIRPERVARHLDQLLDPARSLEAGEENSNPSEDAGARNGPGQDGIAAWVWRPKQEAQKINR